MKRRVRRFRFTSAPVPRRFRIASPGGPVHHGDAEDTEIAANQTADYEDDDDDEDDSGHGHETNSTRDAKIQQVGSTEDAEIAAVRKPLSRTGPGVAALGRTWEGPPGVQGGRAGIGPPETR